MTDTWPAPEDEFWTWHARGIEGCIHEDEPPYDLERDAACNCPGS